MVYDTAGQYLLMIYSLAIVCAGMRNSLKAINNSEKLILLGHEYCVSKVCRHIAIKCSSTTCMVQQFLSQCFEKGRAHRGEVLREDRIGLIHKAWLGIYMGSAHHPTGENLQIELKWNASALIF